MKLSAFMAALCILGMGANSAAKPQSDAGIDGNLSRLDTITTGMQTALKNEDVGKASLLGAGLFENTGAGRSTVVAVLSETEKGNDGDEEIAVRLGYSDSDDAATTAGGIPLRRASLSRHRSAARRSTEVPFPLLMGLSGVGLLGLGVYARSKSKAGMMLAKVDYTDPKQYNPNNDPAIQKGYEENQRRNSPENRVRNTPEYQQGASEQKQRDDFEKGLEKFFETPEEPVRAPGD